MINISISFIKSLDWVIRMRLTFLTRADSSCAEAATTRRMSPATTWRPRIPATSSACSVSVSSASRPGLGPQPPVCGPCSRWPRFRWSRAAKQTPHQRGLLWQ